MFLGGTSLAQEEEGFNLILVREASNIRYSFFDELAIKYMKHRVRVRMAEGADHGFTAPRSVGSGPPMIPEQNRGELDSRGNSFKK